jgi:hypothetical protein
LKLSVDGNATAGRILWAVPVGEVDIMVRAMASLAALCLAVLAMVSVVNGLLSYDDALKRTMNRDIDDSVLAAFWREHHQAEQSEDLQRIKSIKVNLGALLLDMANKNKDADSFMAMYEECEKLSHELLTLDVRNLRRKVFLARKRALIDHTYFCSRAISTVKITCEMPAITCGSVVLRHRTRQLRRFAPCTQFHMTRKQSAVHSERPAQCNC